MRELSLYLHVPFCIRRCSYCTFYHLPHSDNEESAFVDSLVEELNAAAADVGEPLSFPTVFFGGGTPSVLSDESFASIFEALLPRVAPDAEITVEANPEDLTSDQLAMLRSHGVNRLSLGIQSMHAGRLRTLRRCSHQTNAQGIALARDYFDNLSLDVLLGVPDGSIDDVSATLETLVEFSPPHFSVYCLEPGGVMQSEVGDFFDRVDPEASADQYLYVCETLRDNGYHHYEVSNFARPGFESRHNRAYWRGNEYLGVGPGAHSFIGSDRFYNEPSLARYLGRDKLTTIRRSEPRGADSRRIEDAMLALRTSDGLPMDEAAGASTVLKDLVSEGLATAVGDRIVLTDRGYLLLNDIVLRVCGAV